MILLKLYFNYLVYNIIFVFFLRMEDLQQLLVETLSICQNARSNLNKGQKSFTIASLGILSNYRKRKFVQDFLKSLNTIKALVILNN